MIGTNSSALTNTARTLAWSPDSKTLAYVHATPGPETADATGDPILITRFLYKPTASEGNTRFNDNRRLHIFLLDVGSGRTRQLTDGVHDEHSHRLVADERRARCSCPTASPTPISSSTTTSSPCA